MHGIDPATLYVRKRHPDNRARAGEMKRMILPALRDGPKTLREIVAVVHAARPDWPYRAAYSRTSTALARYHGDGYVRLNQKLWRISDGADRSVSGR